MSPINERQWQGRVLLKLGELVAQRPELGISRIEQEVEVRIGGERRRYTDPLLYDGESNPVCLLELKLPDRPDGRSPRYLPVVEATHDKASYLGVPYWVTWNVNSAVLWKLDLPGRPPHERSIKQYEVTAIRSSDDLDRRDVARQIDAFLERLLQDLHDLHVGVAVGLPQPLDESFVHTIQTYIDPLLVGVLQEELMVQYRHDGKFANALRRWAVDDQGWTWDDTPHGLPQSLGRTARLACSMLVNKLVFYEALRKVYGLRALTVPSTIRTAQELQKRLQRLFDEVRTNIDYESIFTEELIDHIPFLSDEAVELWRDLIRDVSRFDFTKLDYEIIGSIFERLIAPDERHKLGQYFTPSRVVDLINAFCIRDGTSKVFDPGCGAGTFLVRAYHLQRGMNPGERHEECLRRLWGADIARYAAHLSVINLASRDLSSTENYPRIVHDDFFNIVPGASQYPFHHRAHHGPGVRTEQVLEPVPMFDAVVGNPPYTRQEEMEDLFAGMRDRVHARIFGDWGVEISRRSGIHGLFLLHGSAFLVEGGRLGFLTHSSWVDVNYGRDLQRFLLERFKIVTIIEPQVEHWFPDVDVNTSIVVVERCGDSGERARNLVRFVQVKIPLAELVRQIGGDPDDFASFARLVREIETSSTRVESDSWRVLPVSQDELWRQGIDAQGHYVGTKWGVFLRAPDVYFEILERARASSSLVRLADVAEVRFALKSGANEFFYVTDITDRLSPAELRTFGLTPRQSRRLRVVETEDGDRRVLEAEYLKPILVSTKEVAGLRVDSGWVRRRVLMVTRTGRELTGTRVLRYIREGERRPFGTSRRSGIPASKPTCASRSPWYALDPSNTGRFLWFMNITDIYAVPHNPEEIFADHRFHNISPHRPEHEPLLFGLLNGTFTLLCTEATGRQFAGRGIDSLDVQVTEVKDLPILDPGAVSEQVAQRIISAVEEIAARSIEPIPREVARTDRHRLDDAILEAMGFHDAVERRRVLDDLYKAVTSRLSIRFARARSTRGTRGSSRRQASATALAAELITQIDPGSVRRFPDDFVPGTVQLSSLRVPDTAAEMVRETMDTLQVGRTRITLPSAEAAEFVELALLSGARGELRFPRDRGVLQKVLLGYREYVARMERTIAELAESRTRDRRLQRQIKEVLRQQMGIGRVATHRQLRLI